MPGTFDCQKLQAVMPSAPAKCAHKLFRLVLFDPDWNPATDAQAMARLWREGQRKHVVIYRLLSTGSIEEKIFQRQIKKGEIAEAVAAGQLASGSGGRHFSAEELKALFTLHPETRCDTYELLQHSDPPAARNWKDCSSEVEDGPLETALATGIISFVVRQVEALSRIAASEGPLPKIMAMRDENSRIAIGTPMSNALTLPEDVRHLNGSIDAADRNGGSAPTRAPPCNDGRAPVSHSLPLPLDNGNPLSLHEDQGSQGFTLSPCSTFPPPCLDHFLTSHHAPSTSGARSLVSASIKGIPNATESDHNAAHGTDYSMPNSSFTTKAQPRVVDRQVDDQWDELKEDGFLDDLDEATRGEPLVASLPKMARHAEERLTDGSFLSVGNACFARPSLADNAKWFASNLLKPKH